VYSVTSNETSKQLLVPLPYACTNPT